MATKRNEGESQEHYKARRQLENAHGKALKKSGWWVHRNETKKNGADVEKKVPYNKARVRVEKDLRAAAILVYFIFDVVLPQATPVNP